MTKEMIAEDVPLNILYQRYGKTSDDEIRSLLGRIKIVTEGHKGHGTIFGFYTIDDAALEEILVGPRSISHTYDENMNQPMENVQEFKRIRFLIKSTSRFCLKPDIGEVFDQMSDEDKEQTKAIWTIKDSAFSINSDGDHFVCTAVLLK